MPPVTRCVGNPNPGARSNWLMLSPHRLCKESTSMVASHSRETTWLSTMAPTLTMLSERELARRLCTLLLEGKSIRMVILSQAAADTEGNLV